MRVTIRVDLDDDTVIEVSAQDNTTEFRVDTGYVATVPTQRDPLEHAYDVAKRAVAEMRDGA